MLRVYLSVPLLLINYYNIKCIAVAISTTTAGKLLKSLMISNVLQLMDRQSFVLEPINYVHVLNIDFVEIFLGTA